MDLVNGKKEIPVFTIEEHHEAFFLWNYALKEKLIGEKNILYHFDEHSDMGTPRFNTSINELNNSLEKFRNFTYEELDIASFIIPSIYLGIFDQVYWFKQYHKVQDNEGVNYYVRSFNNAGKKLLSGKKDSFNFDTPCNDLKEFKYYYKTVENIPSNIGNVILDIDLDYFSCNGNPFELNELYVEITKSEFLKFNNNKYHKLIYSGLKKIKTIKKNNKYYFLINSYNEIYPCKLKVDNETILKRIDILTTNLKQKQIVPSLITICRSRHSGYTPKDQYKLIESNLINRLKENYSIKEYKISELTRTFNYKMNFSDK